MTSPNPGSPRFVIVGSLNIDLVASLPRLPKAHEKLRVQQWVVTDGGAGGNTASWLAFLDRVVELVSAVGRDDYGKRLIANLHRSGVGVASVEESSTEPTGMAVAMSVGETKYIVSLAGPCRRSAVAAFPRDRFASDSHLHLIGEPTSAFRELAKAAIARGATVSLEANGYDPSPLIDCIDLCFMNSDELRRIDRSRRRSDITRARALIGDHRCWVIITQGAKGAAAVSRQVVVRATTTRVDPVDPTGAGDAFDAGFLHAWTNERNIDTALSNGLLLATRVISQIGSRPDTPSRTPKGMANP